MSGRWADFRTCIGSPDGVDLVQHADSRDVDSVALDNIDDVLDRGVRLVNGDSRRIHPVLAQHRSDFARVDLGERHCVRDGNLTISSHTRVQRNRDTHSAGLPLLHRDRWRLLVQPDSKALQLIRDDFQVVQRLEHVQNNENEVTRPRDSDDLSPSTFTILGTLDNTGQIENLYSRTVVRERSGNGREGREFV